jgi:hypothetical protein
MKKFSKQLNKLKAIKIASLFMEEAVKIYHQIIGDTSKERGEKENDFFILFFEKDKEFEGKLSLLDLCNEAIKLDLEKPGC